MIQASSEAIVAQKARDGQVPQVISELGEAKASKEQFEQEIKEHKVDRMVSDSGEMQTKIATVGEPYERTRKGKGSNLLQTTAVSQFAGWSLRWTCLRW